MKLSPIGSAKTPTSKSRRRRRTCRWQFVRLSVPLSRCLSCCPCLCDVARRPVTAARRRRLLVSRSSSVLGIAVLLLQTFTRLAAATCNVDQQYSCAKAVADERLSYLSGGGECIAKPYVQFTHLCSVNSYLPTVDFCCCAVSGRDVTGTGGHVTYDDDYDSSAATSPGALCCRYHQDWNHFRCLDVDDAVMLAEVSTESQSSDGYFNLPVSVFVPAVLSSLALIVCCLCCCLRCCGCCNCCLATREHQSLLTAGSATTHQSQRLSDSVVDDNHVTSKSVPGYCDVIDDNMASECQRQLYHHHQYHHRLHHWTVAPPPPSYSATNWDSPLQPSAPQPDSAYLTGCDDDTVTSRTHYVMDSATIANQDTTHSSGDSLPPATCPLCRRQRPVCV